MGEGWRRIKKDGEGKMCEGNIGEMLRRYLGMRSLETQLKNGEVERAKGKV